MELDINQTLYDAYDQIIKNLNHSNDSRYKFFFMQHDEVGRIKLGPKKKLYNINKKVCDIVNNCEIQMKRELLVIIDDGKTAKKFICDNMLESYLSEIRKELNKKRMIVQKFKFLKEDLQEEYLHEVHTETEESITLAEILIDDNVIRVLLNDSSISSDEEMYTSLDEEILFDFLSYDEKILCEPRSPFLKNETVEHYKQHIYKCQLDYGLTFTNEGVILGTYSCDFTAKISTCERNQIFFEKNMINDFPSELQDLLNHDNLFLNNRRYIYFTIVNQRIKLNLNKDSIKPSEEFKCAINKAIEGTDLYINYLKLLNVFAAFGNFFAQNIVIGKKLLKYVEIDNNDHIEDKTEWSTIEDFRKISTKLENMLSYINNENLLVNSWVESCYQDGTKLNVIEYGDLISIYEIFKEPTRSQIKRILDIHDHNNTLLKTLKLSEEVKMIKKPDFKQEILMIDSIQVDASVIYYRVKFKNKLKSDNYQLYGSVTTTSGQQLSERIIKFKAINVFGFSVIVENIFDKRHEDFPALPHTLKTTVVEKKENTNSFNQPFTKIVQSKKLASRNVLLTESKKTSFIYRDLKFIQGRYKNKQEQIIFYIIQNLCMYNNYKVCGYWECSECMESKFVYENQHNYGTEYYSLEPYYLKVKPYSQGSLENFLKMAPGQLYNSLVEFCRSDNCNRKLFITSFRMYSDSQPINLNEIPINEVICHLQCDKDYKVFGEWECTNCKNFWKSAYTWISLQKFIQQDPDLNSDDYFMQNCKRCKSDKSVIKLYKPLDKGEGNINNSGKMNINWMLVGNPEIVESLQEFKNLHKISYEQTYFRNLIVVETGEVTIKPSKEQNWEISIETLPNLPSDAVFTCTFKYPLSNNEPSFMASVKSYNENGILVTNVTSHTHNFLNNPEKDGVNDSNIFDYNENENDQDERLKYQVHWCIYLTPIQIITIGQFFNSTDLLRLSSRKFMDHDESADAQKQNSKITSGKFLNKEVDIITQMKIVNSIKLNEDLENELFENEIMKKSIKFIPWNELKNISKLDDGHFGFIRKAYWTKTHSDVFCKGLVNLKYTNGGRYDEFIHELTMHARLDLCENIVRFLGVSKDTINDQYFLIMEYANDGSLRRFLKKFHHLLNWHQRLELAYQITKGLCYLHSEEIIHSNLLFFDQHDKNIVIRDGKAKITDFGNAISINTQTNIHTDLFGMISFLAPELLEQSKSNGIPYCKKTDIYSLGMIFWELSSGHPPFENQQNYIILSINIIQGFRENMIPGTPEEYKNLYNKCWDADPDKRPDIEYVHTLLEGMTKILPNTDSIAINSEGIIISLFGL
ncbi:23878_t:CDS:2 [Cetraspora pellucida]|uniref:23878_t:CDS:1 n=1 Tax=Cetraspora pellucida TaxID=1433469 RepID=A0A9N9CJ88_9GLOM|nr:23878_t:CDS:2 [Cetraspora pellucida]